MRRAVGSDHGQWAAWGHENSLGHAVRVWRGKLGLRDELRLYDGRGTFCTRALNAGLTLWEIALAKGWTTETAALNVETYARLHPNATDSALIKISKHIK